MERAIVLATSSVAIRDAVERVLGRMDMPIRHELSAASAASTARACACAVVCTLDLDWKALIRELHSTCEIAPPVLLLLPAPDGRLWAEALISGAFGAVVMTQGADQLLTSVEKARARWTRAQLVRDALRQNPIAQRVA